MNQHDLESEKGGERKEGEGVKHKGKLEKTTYGRGERKKLILRESVFGVQQFFKRKRREKKLRTRGTGRIKRVS